MENKDYEEYKRLKSLESHQDTYEIGNHGFLYHEMMDIYTITIVEFLPDGSVDTIERFTASLPMGHDTFVDWCNRWEAGNE